MLSNIILKWLSAYTEEIIEHQCGFRLDRSIMDEIFVMRQVMEKCYDYNIDLHIFIDFRQAFDSR
jgi:hypothetical protein